MFFIEGEKVLIEIIFKNKADLPALISLLQTEYQFDFTSSEIDIEEFEDDFIIAGFLPIPLLNQLSQETQFVQYFRPAIPPVKNKGITTSQGDKVLRSDLVRVGYSHFEGDPTINGAGIRIGILSDSYATRTDAGVFPLNETLPTGTCPHHCSSLKI